MDEIKRLERQIDDLQNQLRIYQNKVKNEVNTELAKMDTEYKRLLSDTKKTEALLKQKNDELNKAISEIRADISKRNQGNSNEAKEYLSKTIDIYRTIEVKPHEKFEPKRLQIFYNTIKDCQALLKSGLFEAATAVAISAKSGLKRLGFSIDDKVNEWDSYYHIFTQKVNDIQEKIKQALSDWSTLTKQDRSALVDINYWSNGEFASIAQRVNELYLIIEKVNKMGKDAYLKTSDSADTDTLKQFIEERDKLDTRLSPLFLFSTSRYSASCQRSDWGEAIIDFFTTEINLLWHEKLSGYKTAPSEILTSKDFQDYVGLHFPDQDITQDTRQWLSLVFENASGEYIYIYILPIESPEFVTNHIIIHIDFAGAEQAQYAKDIYHHLCEAIHYTDDLQTTINYTSDINELKHSENGVYKEMGKDLESVKVSTK